MYVVATVEEPYYDHNGRKFVSLDISSSGHLREIKEEDSGLEYPSCVGDIMRVKVPFRHRRPVVTTIGLRGVRSVKKGETVRVSLDYTGRWRKEDKFGNTWVMKSIEVLA